MLDKGFQGLSQLLTSGRPLRVVVLDTQGHSDAGGEPTSASFGHTRDRLAPPRKEVALLAMTHRGVFGPFFCPSRGAGSAPRFFGSSRRKSTDPGKDKDFFTSRKRAALRLWLAAIGVIVLMFLNHAVRLAINR